MADTFFSIDHRVNPLVIRFDALKIGMLQFIGYDVKKALYQKFLRGQAIFLRKEIDVNSRRTYSYTTIRDGGQWAVKISSYPLNIWEKTFTRYGKTYPGKRVFSEKLPPIGLEIAGRNANRYMENFVKRLESRA